MDPHLGPTRRQDTEGKPPLQVGDIKTKRSAVLKMSDSGAITCLAWSPDGTHLAAGNDSGDMIVIDLRR